MLLTEDGHLDIEKVKMLNEAQLEEEMKSWNGEMLFEWEGRNGVMSIDEAFAYIFQKINEYYDNV